jgi:glycosyltransferase involved in cell wall biosynthesis
MQAPQPNEIAAPPQLTLAICTWNRAARLRRLLTSVLAAAPPSVPWEVLVVDNNSTDATRVVASKLAGPLPLRYVFEGVQGSSAARNRGLEEARGDLVVFIDDDVTIAPDFLTTYENASSAHPDAAFFGGTIRVCFEQPEPAWVRFDPMSFVSMFGQLHVPRTVTAIGARKVPYGANFAVRRSRVGAERFDLDLALGVKGKERINGEETLFLTRLLGAGLVGRWLPDAVVQHWIPPELATPRHLWRYFVAMGRLQARQRGCGDASVAPSVVAGDSARAAASHLLHAGLRVALRKRSWVAHLRLAAVAFGEHRESTGRR